MRLRRDGVLVAHCGAFGPRKCGEMDMHVRTSGGLGAGKSLKSSDRYCGELSGSPLRLGAVRLFEMSLLRRLWRWYGPRSHLNLAAAYTIETRSLFVLKTTSVELP